MALGKHVDVEKFFEKASAKAKERTDSKKPHLHSLAYSSRFVTQEVPKYELPQGSIPACAAYQLVHDELLLDAESTKNMATYVTSWMEPEAIKLFMESFGKNFADQDEYPRSIEIQNRCVNMLARLWNATKGDKPVGTFTTGSSEAFMLAGLALKFNWRKRRQQKNLPTDKPNLVFGCNAQVCIEKFARYFDVEPRMVPVTHESHFVMDPEKAVQFCDENTIGVIAILGSTYNGYFEDVGKLSQLLDQLQQEKGLDIPIHIDAASGGFVAPFVYPELEWDFRLPRVKSINTSGHKYGLVYPGVGWVIFRDEKELSPELVFHLDYLGGDEPTYTLNFSRSAAQVIGQYYNFLRLGRDGYTEIISSCLENARFFSLCLEDSGYFKLLSEVHKEKAYSLPVIAFSLRKEDNQLLIDEHDISSEVRKKGWIVPAYRMAKKCQDTMLMRVVVRECHSKDLLEALLVDLITALESLQAKEQRRLEAFSTTHSVQRNVEVLREIKKEESGVDAKGDKTHTTFTQVC